MLSRAARLLSGCPAIRLAAFFDGNKILGSTATMSISTIARMTRRSTWPLGLSASGRLALRHRVVAARMQRVAAQDALHSQPASFEPTVTLDRLACVLRAAAREATLREHQMRQRPLVRTAQSHSRATRPA